MPDAYFDASRPDGFVVVAGWLASPEAWNRFEADWHRILVDARVPYFHTVEFAHSVGPFDGWRGDEERRRRLLALLLDAVRDHVAFGLACVVQEDTFADVNGRYRLAEWFGNPYCLAARHCVARMNEYQRARGEALPRTIFEHGDPGQAMLRPMLVNSGLSAPVFMAGKPAQDVPHAVQLQAADLAAYEVKKGVERGEAVPAQAHRYPLRFMADIPSEWGIYTRDNLIDLCRNAGTPER